MVTLSATQERTTITICHWATYQADFDVREQQVNNERTTSEQQMNTVEEGKEGKERTIARFLKPTIKEIRDYCRERNNSVDPQTFIDHYESNGWRIGKAPMKDWRAAVRTWERNGVQRGKPTAAEPIDNMPPSPEETRRILGIRSADHA